MKVTAVKEKFTSSAVPSSSFFAQLSFNLIGNFSLQDEPLQHAHFLNFNDQKYFFECVQFIEEKLKLYVYFSEQDLSQLEEKFLLLHSTTGDDSSKYWSNLGQFPTPSAKNKKNSYTEKYPGTIPKPKREIKKITLKKCLLFLQKSYSLEICYSLERNLT